MLCCEKSLKGVMRSSLANYIYGFHFLFNIAAELLSLSPPPPCVCVFVCVVCVLFLLCVHMSQGFLQLDDIRDQHDPHLKIIEVIVRL